MGEIGDARRESGSDIVCLEGNGIRPSHMGNGWSVGGVMYTLNSTEVHCVCYSIGAVNSKAWLDGKPDTGVHEIDIARTLDSFGDTNPDRNQGGVCIIEIHKP